MKRGQAARIVVVIALVWVVAGAFVAWRLATAPVLPDVAALEAQLEEAVANGAALGDVVALLEAQGFDCTPSPSDSDAADSNAMAGRFCEIVEREPKGELDCPMRVTVTLLFDDTVRAVGYSVMKGAFCM